MCASRLRIPLLAFVAMTLLAGPVFAAEKKNDPASVQARRLQQANRKLGQEKAQLAKEKVEIEARLKEAEDKIGSAQDQAAGAARRAARLGKDLEALRSEKEILAGKLAETEKQLADTTGQLRNETDERKRLEGLAAAQKQSIAQCEALNAKMHAEGVALLDKYRDKGCFDAALQSEPFTGLKQVEIENFVEDSRDKLDELRIDARAQH